MIFRHDEEGVGPTTSEKSDAEAQPQVLLVDHVRAIRGFIAAVLRSNGYRVLEAEDSLTAQFILAVEHPALVISDLEMPNGDGWAVLAYCHARHPDIPVLVVSATGLGTRPEIERWAAGFLRKPFRLEQFYADVRRLLFHAA